jgi:diguanylate cyclase (GGDEF)-like protein
VTLAISALLFWLIGSLATIVRLRDELLEQATHDPLTGLYNRRYMEEWLRHELHRARRHGRPVGAVMLDVDHFKRVNDRFGHEAGDVVLREIALAVKRAARKSDIVCRYGGEEFLVLMPEAALRDAARKAEELRGAVGAMRLESRGRPVGPITISLGVAAFPDNADDADALLRCADDALYAAKQAGRDRVAVSPRAETTAPAEAPRAAERGSITLHS